MRSMTIQAPAWRTLSTALLAALAVGVSAHGEMSPAERRADAALAGTPKAHHDGPTAAESDPLSMSLLELTVRGGYLMIPIGLISVVVVAIGVERAMAIRRRRVLPPRMVDALGDMARRGSIDWRQVQQLVALFPSSLARVVETLASKAGRPLPEVEQALSDACQRESDELYANVRTLNLATSVAPLLGLLGTVSGMIQAFFMTAHLPMNVNKGEALAEGIYIALVTTFAGLSVAIPAAVLVHLFESRILRLLRDGEQLVRPLLPLVESPDGTRQVASQLAGPHGLAKNWAVPRPDAKAS